VQTYVFYTAVALQAGKVVTSVTLPSTLVNQGQLHVFAMTVSGAASSPTATSTRTTTSTATSTSTSTSTSTPSTATATSTPSTATATSTRAPSTATATSTRAPSTATATATATSISPVATAIPTSTSTLATTPLFATGFESGDPQPTGANTVDTTGGGGGVLNVGGICCGVPGPEAGPRNETAHAGSSALMYSGNDTSATSSYAYLKVFDLSTRNIVVGPTTTLSYWIYPQSSVTSPVGVSGSNSSCVVVDLVFADGTNLHTAGAVDQGGNPLKPSAQCGHLTLDTWNHVTSTIGAVTSGKTIVRLDVGYDQPANTGGYRGYIDDIGIHN